MQTRSLSTGNGTDVPQHLAVLSDIAPVLRKPGLLARALSASSCLTDMCFAACACCAEGNWGECFLHVLRGSSVDPQGGIFGIQLRQERC